LIPISLPRDLSALRFTSMFSVIMSIFIVLIVIFSCLCNRNTTPLLADGTKVTLGD
jgi:amino acid permease